MARDNVIRTIIATKAAASAGTGTTYHPVGSRPFLFQGFAWLYETTEANADNTLDFVIDYTTDGGGAYTELFTNANAVGLADTSAVLTLNSNKGNAASGGGAAVAVTPTEARVPANAVIRVRLVTAGTGTVPAVQMLVEGKDL